MSHSFEACIPELLLFERIIFVNYGVEELRPAFRPMFPQLTFE